MTAYRWFAVIVVSVSATVCAPATFSPPKAAVGTAVPVGQTPAKVIGRVLDAGRKPVFGALVALIPKFELSAWDGTTLPVTSTSGEDGLFRFEKVAPGTYAVTAHATGLTGGYGGVVSVSDESTAKVVTIELGSPGFLVDGSVTEANGAPIAGAIVQLVRFSERRGDIYVAHTDVQGHYELEVPGGVPYLVVVDAPPRPRFHKTIQPYRSSLNAQLGAAPAPRPADDVLRSWLESKAFVLAGTEPGTGMRDLEPLREMIGSARFVGVGEATHGSVEFFRLKHRLLEFLVLEMGFRVLAVEHGWGSCLAANDYVLHGKGEVLDIVRHLEWTEEWVDTLRWMRRYNENPGHAQKIELQGFDVVGMDEAEPALRYLKVVDAGRAEENEKLLSRFQTQDSPAWGEDGVGQGLDELLARIDASRKAWTAQTSKEKWALARRHVEQVRHARRIFMDPLTRDEHLANNVGQIVASYPPGTRFMLSAHNAHVGVKPTDWSDLGERLRQLWGVDYFVLGTTFERGSFLAFEYLPEGSVSKRKAMLLGAAPRGTLAQALGSLGKPLFLLDLRTAPASVRDWLSGPVPTWQVGGAFRGEEAALRRHPWGESFDALIHVREVTAARSP